MKEVIPIIRIKKWKNNNEIIEFCNHIISHSERYEKERVFESKQLLDNLRNKKKLLNMLVAMKVL